MNAAPTPKLDLSVIICAHNPRPAYMQRTLRALADQTLPMDRWELLVIDNASKEELIHKYRLDWHPNARCLREDELGLTAARVRGIVESRSTLLVFVDDDNVLSPDYLESALKIVTEYPWLGVYGASRILPEYEEQPSPELNRYLYMLALRNSERDLFANLQGLTAATPYGAGLCVRAEVGQKLVASKRAGGVMFDRKGKDLFSSGDLEFSLVAADCGLGQGVFRRLSLTHLIPAERVRIDYLVRLAEGMNYSNNLLNRLRSRELGEPPRSIIKEIGMMLNVVFRTAKARGVHRRFEWRSGCGRVKAFRRFRRIAKETVPQQQTNPTM
jgi:glycosyltransferase involved in cell wall biosynthesis